MNVCSHADFLALLAQPNLGGILNTRPHHIACLTYNDVRGYPQGEIPSGKPDVRITIATGKLYDNAQFRLGSFIEDAGMATLNVSMMQLGCDIRNDAAVSVQENIEQDARFMSDEQCGLTVFLYASLSARDAACKTLIRIREDFPHGQCHVVTCDCCTPEDFSGFEHLIDTLIISSWCGGRDTLGDIVRAACIA